MNQADMHVLLQAIARVQPQSTDDVTVGMWSETLREDMTVDWAVRWVGSWAAKNTDQTARLLPGHLNAAWKDHQHARRLALQTSVSGPIDDRKPMPEWFKAAVHDSFRSKQRPTDPDGEPMSVGAIFMDAMTALAAPPGAPVLRRCSREGCMCAHTDCFDGWLDTNDEKAHPCRVCKPSLASVLAEIPAPGVRSSLDFERVRNHAKDVQ